MNANAGRVVDVCNRANVDNVFAVQLCEGQANNPQSYKIPRLGPKLRDRIVETHGVQFTLRAFANLPLDDMRNLCVGNGSNMVKCVWVQLRRRLNLPLPDTRELLEDRR